MKLIKLEIKGLFDLFDYVIPLSNSENLTIITGPNGFGKTMILNIIDSFFNRNFSFFEKLSFKEINFFFEGSKYLNIIKNSESNQEYDVKFSLFEEQVLINEFLYIGRDRYESNLANTPIPSNKPFRDFFKAFDNDHEKWLNDANIKNKELSTLIESIDVHLIKEQRLFQKITKKNGWNSNEGDFQFSETIQEYAKELSSIINTTINDSFKISQELDSSFPKRLLNEQSLLTELEFKNRFDKLKTKQEKLKKFGLSESLQEVPNSFIDENAKVLLVYLNDSEKKSSVFDDLLERLELFTNILNNRRFTYKSIKIDKEKGFVFVTSKDKPLNLIDLSSGEQHEVILLYELIFKAKPNTLVLIDEPEISLHVTWQKEFLNDLIKIIELQKIQVIIATHSPQIINNRWDLTINLEKSDS